MSEPREHRARVLTWRRAAGEPEGLWGRVEELGWLPDSPRILLQLGQRERSPILLETARSLVRFMRERRPQTRIEVLDPDAGSRVGDEVTVPASGRHARYLDTKVFGSLDGLRALSIMAVVWHHANAWHHTLWPDVNVGPASWPISSRGFLGVDLFFVISGFLILTLLLRERRRTGAISLRSFYVRRFLRIFPAYYLMLFVVVSAAYLKPGSNSHATWRELPFALFYVSNLVAMSSPLAITWSLATEEQFYVVVPTLEKYAGHVFPLLLPVLYVLLSLPPLGLFPNLNLPDFFRQTTFGPILLGVMLAHVLDDPRGYRWVSRLLEHWISPLVAGVIVLLACSCPVGDVDGWPRLAIHWSLLLLVASCVVRERHVLRPVLSLSPLRRIGVVSYGIYLYHPLVLYVAYRTLNYFSRTSELLFVLVAIVGSWSIAELSYRMFESRFLALKQRFGGTALLQRGSY